MPLLPPEDPTRVTYRQHHEAIQREITGLWTATRNARIKAGNATPKTVAYEGGPGGSTNYSREDHVHPIDPDDLEAKDWLIEGVLEDVMAENTEYPYFVWDVTKSC